VIIGGGGESTITQRLRRKFEDLEWCKKNVKEQHIVDGVALAAISHEVDHFKTFENGRIALEIEWNNKDPFFDRDLENFRKLHQIGYIDVGVIITRGASLQRKLSEVFVDHYSQIQEVDSITCTVPQRKRISKALQQGKTLGEAAGLVLFKDKFGTATTHWDKLIVRVEQRGLGKPCPLLLIGLEETILV
jgi:hypothetical protein